MTTVQLGVGAYKRRYAGAPEIRCLNRWVEKAPDNLKEQIRLLTRPGTTQLLEFDPGTFGNGSMRGNYTLSGLFNDSLFVVCGSTLYRVNSDMTITTIEGVVNGTGYPEVTWAKGAGYERLWIADGLLLQYYGGTTQAFGTLTLTGSITPGTDAIEIGGVYYIWGTTFSGTDNGTSTHPFVVAPTGTATDPLSQLVLAIMDSGTPGVDYSNTIGGPNSQVTVATVGTGVPPSQVTVTAISAGTDGNSITTTVVGGTALTFSSITLLNGGIDALQGCAVPGGLIAKSVTEVSSYVLVSIGNAQQFYFINPGEVTIDPLNFASKESSPDDIIAMRTVGDQVLIIGSKSTENWYATGDLTAPFAPIEGRVYQRGCIDGTPIVVDDGVLLVGDDGRVYSVGYSQTVDIPWGVNRISDNGIEERIRRQLRREAGLTP